jgi:hypothetical protein
VLALLACAFLLLIEVKFTGLVYAVLMIAGLATGAWMWDRRHDAVRYAVILFCLGLFAVGVPGYQPYVTNTLINGHPFYPAVGQEGSRNVQWKQASPEFLALNRVVKLGISVFSSSSNTAWEWKIPFFIDKSELMALTGADARYAGLGPLYSGALVLAILLVIFMTKALAATELKVFALLLAILGVTIFINPEAWWARLSPQLWLLPLIPVVVTVSNPARWKPWFGVLVVAVMLANSLMVGLYNVKYAIDRSAEFTDLFQQLREVSKSDPIEITLSKSYHVATTQRLEQNGVSYRSVVMLDCVPAHSFSHILKSCDLGR